VNQRTNRGFTMIELMIVVVMIAIMVAIAVPSFASFIANYRATTAVNDLLQAVTQARTEALKQGRRVIVLPNNASGTPSTTGSWTNGWVIFADLNNNQTFDASTESVIFRHAVLPTSTTVAPPSGGTGIFGAANYVLFDGTGYPHTGATGSLGGIQITDSVGSKKSIRTLCLALLGRPRIVQTTDTCSSG
jgi:type IV fimbrial biogenesis protein FimT